LVWANLHGSFVLGILALFLYLSFEFLKIKKILDKYSDKLKKDIEQFAKRDLPLSQHP